ncbi:MAG: phosphoribosylglycinamide formyltransferase [Bacteroidota bacterium]
MKNIAIFASGSGTNAENIIQFFRTTSMARVSLVLCNKPGAGVLERARRFDIETVVFSRDQFYETNEVLRILIDRQTDLVVLAGFLWLVPPSLLQAYPGRVINIHPALLPQYGGKGMYGEKVHEAVIRNGEKESGITIHYVNERYDEGSTIFQARCSVEPGESPESLARKVHELEYRHYPQVISDLLEGI